MSPAFTPPEKFHADPVWVQDAALRTAARDGDDARVQQILANGVNPDAAMAKDSMEYYLHAGGRTALMEALLAGQCVIALRLLLAGAGVVHQDEDGLTVLSAWYAKARPDTLREEILDPLDYLLLDMMFHAGARPWSVDAHGGCFEQHLRQDHGCDWWDRQCAAHQQMRLDACVPATLQPSLRSSARL